MLKNVCLASLSSMFLFFLGGLYHLPHTNKGTGLRENENNCLFVVLLYSVFHLKCSRRKIDDLRRQHFKYNTIVNILMKFSQQ
jgi:hypothetical protein